MTLTVNSDGKNIFLYISSIVCVTSSDARQTKCSLGIKQMSCSFEQMLI